MGHMSDQHQPIVRTSLAGYLLAMTLFAFLFGFWSSYRDLVVAGAFSGMVTSFTLGILTPFRWSGAFAGAVTAISIAVNADAIALRGALRSPFPLFLLPLMAFFAFLGSMLRITFTIQRDSSI
jgi:hypothetical protein